MSSSSFIRHICAVFDAVVSDVIFRWTSRITSEEWLVLVFMEACRLKGVNIHVAEKNVGLDYLEVLKKDTEQSIKRNVILTKHQRAIDARKNSMEPAKQDFHEEFNSSGVMHMQRIKLLEELYSLGDGHDGIT
jgi:hypothetical protein